MKSLQKLSSDLFLNKLDFLVCRLQDDWRILIKNSFQACRKKKQAKKRVGAQSWTDYSLRNIILLHHFWAEEEMGENEPSS